MRLADLEGLDHQELADRTGVSLTAAKSRVQRARQHLREMILDCCRLERDARGGVVDYQTTDRALPLLRRRRRRPTRQHRAGALTRFPAPFPPPGPSTRTKAAAVAGPCASKPEEIQRETARTNASPTSSARSTGRSPRAACRTDDAGVRAVAEAFGYSADELDAIPAEANMGLSCGNPTAMASLRPGEVVVDLGCGGGLDVFLAAQKVGPTGKAIGIDMTPEMIARARKAAADGGLRQRRVPPGDDRPHPAAGRVGRLRDQQLRDQPRARQAGRLPRDVPRAQARRARGGQRHRPEAAAARRSWPRTWRRTSAASPARSRSTTTPAACARPGSTRCRSSTPARTSTRTPRSRASPPAARRRWTPSRCRCRWAGRRAAGADRQPTAAAAVSCCGPAAAEKETVHGGLATLTQRYDINEYAASVKVYAVKPG